MVETRSARCAKVLRYTKLRDNLSRYGIFDAWNNLKRTIPFRDEERRSSAYSQWPDQEQRLLFKAIERELSDLRSFIPFTGFQRDVLREYYDTLQVQQDHLLDFFYEKMRDKIPAMSVQGPLLRSYCGLHPKEFWSDCKECLQDYFDIPECKHSFATKRNCCSNYAVCDDCGEEFEF